LVEPDFLQVAAFCHACKAG